MATSFAVSFHSCPLSCAVCVLISCKDSSRKGFGPTLTAPFTLINSLKAYLQFGPSQWTSEDLFSWSLCLLPCFVAGYFFFLRLYLAHYSAYLPRLSIHRGPYLADLVLLDNQIQSHLRTHFYQCDLWYPEWGAAQNLWLGLLSDAWVFCPISVGCAWL